MTQQERESIERGAEVQAKRLETGDTKAGKIAGKISSTISKDKLSDLRVNPPLPSFGNRLAYNALFGPILGNVLADTMAITKANRVQSSTKAKGEKATKDLLKDQKRIAKLEKKIRHGSNHRISGFAYENQGFNKLASRYYNKAEKQEAKWESKLNELKRKNSK